MVVTDPQIVALAMATPGEIVRAPISTDAGFRAVADAERARDAALETFQAAGGRSAR